MPPLVAPFLHLDSRSSLLPVLTARGVHWVDSHLSVSPHPDYSLAIVANGVPPGKTGSYLGRAGRTAGSDVVVLCHKSKGMCKKVFLGGSLPCASFGGS